ncbi:MAG: extracellular solute-binding protein, partial [Chloroflexota bacterium]
MCSKRLYIGLVAVLVLITLLAAQCGAAPATPAPATEKPAAAPAATEEAVANDKPFAGTELVLASMTDQYVTAFRYLVPKFEEETGVKVTLDELGYVDLYQKLTADFVGHTASYDLMTVDIVWSGEFAANRYTLPLDDFMARDEAELQLDDIMPVA